MCWHSLSLVALASLLCACADKPSASVGSKAGTVQEASPARVEPPQAPSTGRVEGAADSSGAVTEQARAEDAVLPEAHSDLVVSVKPVARGCAVAQQLVLRDDAHQVWGFAQGRQALVLRSDRRTLERWQVATQPRLLGTLRHAQPIAKLAVLRDLQQALAFVDDKGDVWLLRDPARLERAKPERLAQGADRRFAPALAAVRSQLLLAFTRTVDEAMHTFVVRSDKPEPFDLTPAGHGASAASFVLGVTPPVLVMLDARAGISPLLEVPFDAQGVPAPAIVRTPVSQPFAPPLLAAVQVPAGELEVAFSAIGKLAATAVGRVPLRRAVGPVALHPSRGYGELSFDVALSPKAALFALEVPNGEAAGAAHGIELKWLDAQGEGQTLAVPSTGSARVPSLVASARPGQLLLTYTAQARAHAVWVVCDN